MVRAGRVYNTKARSGYSYKGRTPQNGGPHLGPFHVVLPCGLGVRARMRLKKFYERACDYTARDRGGVDEPYIGTLEVTTEHAERLV